MKTTAKSITASVAGLALLAVAAYPGPSAAAGGATAPVQLAQMSQQLAHMSQGQGGGPGAMGQGMGTGAMGPGAMGQGMGPGAMGRGFMGQGMGRGTMGQGMMPMMMRMHRAMMGRGMMGQGMMGRGFANHGMRVTPSLNITVKDVRRFLEKRLEWMGNKRLKVGAIKKADDDTITADIVTVDDSLVQRFTIDRATGWMHKAK